MWLFEFNSADEDADGIDDADACWRAECVYNFQAVSAPSIPSASSSAILTSNKIIIYSINIHIPHQLRCRSHNFIYIR